MRAQRRAATRQCRVPTPLLAAIALLSTLATLSLPAAAGNVVMLTSGALSAYDSAAAGFGSAFSGNVTRFTLEGTGATTLQDHMASLRPDAVVAIGLRAALYARDHFPREPIVFCVVQDPSHRDLRGEWITGVSTNIAPEAELAALRLAAPDVHRVAVFFGESTGVAFARGARAAAVAQDFELIEVPLADLSQLAGRARDVAPRADAFWMPADPTVAASEPFRFLLKLSLDQRKPLLTFADALVRAGALVAVTPDYAAAGVQAAELVRRIQAGERAGDIPVATVRRRRLVVNEATARALGRDLPVAVRREAEVLP